MASSGSLDTSAYSDRYLTFSWEVTSQSIVNNTTTISWTLKGAGGSTTKYYQAGYFTVVIDGETVYSTGEYDRIALYNGTTVASGTYTFTHSSDGTKSFTVNVQAGIYLYEINCTGSATFTLDTIARKSTLTASNGTLGVAQTLTVNRQDSSLTHTITYKCGSTTGTICTKSSATSISWTPPSSLASNYPTATSVSITLTIETFSGSTSIGTNTTTITCAIPDSVGPSVSISWSDETGYASSYGYPIKGLSQLKVVVTATPAEGAAIATYSTTVGDIKYSDATFTTDVLKTAGTITITATVKDQRGRTGTATQDITVLDYEYPSITKLTVGRCDSSGTANDQGSYVKITFSCTVTSLSNTNSSSYKLQYKKSSDDDYTTVNLTALSGSYSVTDYSYIISADSGSSYDVIVSVTDNFTTSTRSNSASTGYTLMSFKANGRGMAVGKVSEKDDTFELGMKAWSSYGHFISSPVEVTSGANLNNYTDVGYFIIGTSSIASSLSNRPSGAGSYPAILEVLPGNTSTYVIQRYTQCYTGDQLVWQRSYAGSWSSWKLLCGNELVTEDITFTSASGFTASYYFCAIQGDVVTISLRGYRDSYTTAKTLYQIGTIPSEYAPPCNMYVPCFIGAITLCVCYITTSGTVSIYSASDMASGSSNTVKLDATWNIAASSQV